VGKFMNFSPHEILFGCQIKENKMGRTYNMHGEKKNSYTALVGKTELKRSLGNGRRRWKENFKRRLKCMS
jgi:hypothetical protein